eukprot:scaffold1931_cov215-Ochromonas_danica.AAC.12
MENKEVEAPSSSPNESEPQKPLDATANVPEVPSEVVPTVPPPALVSETIGEAIGEKPADPTELPTETKSVEAVAESIEHLTIFGNKSLDELHRIQAKRSHLSAGEPSSSNESLLLLLLYPVDNDFRCQGFCSATLP